MQPGRLKHRVRFEQVTETADSYGDQVEVWSEFATRYGAYNALRGDELFAAQQINTEAVGIVTVRYLPGVTEKMRIVLNGLNYNILHIDNVRLENKELVIKVATGLRD